MLKQWVWIMAIGLVLAGGASNYATGLVYDLTKLKSVCVHALDVHPDIERHLGLSKEAISNHVYVWLKGKLPRLRVERYLGTYTGTCEPLAPGMVVHVDLRAQGGRKEYFGSLNIQLIRSTRWETGNVSLGVAYDKRGVIAGPFSKPANHVYDALDDLLTDFAAEYYKAGNP